MHYSTNRRPVGTQKTAVAASHGNVLLPTGKVRIGVVAWLRTQGGGVYQYSLSLLRGLQELRGNGCEDDFILFTNNPSDPVAVDLKASGWTVAPAIPRSLKDKLQETVSEGWHRHAWRWLRKRASRPSMVKAGTPATKRHIDTITVNPQLRASYLRHSVELILFPFYAEIAFEIGIPYVMAIHDLQHRLHPEFPEVSANGEWEAREYCFRNGARYATLLLADSAVGKEDILNCYAEYGVTEDRVKILPYLPASYLAVEVSQTERARVKVKYGLPPRFLLLSCAVLAA